MNSIFKSSLGELFPHKSTFVPRLELEFSPVDLKLLSINRMVHNNLPRLPYQTFLALAKARAKKQRLSIRHYRFEKAASLPFFLPHYFSPSLSQTHSTSTFPPSTLQDSHSLRPFPTLPDV